MNYESGDRIKKLMKERGVKNVDIQKQLNISRNQTINILKGNNTSAINILEIANILDSSVEYLLTGKINNPELNKEENEIIEIFRMISTEDKIQVRKILKTFVQNKETDKKNNLEKKSTLMIG